MPVTKILFYKESDGSVPLIDWLERQKPQKIKDKCLALVRLLANRGYELHRPHSDILRDGVRELRTRFGSVNYRILYFYHGNNCVALTHGITKEAKVPAVEIDKAIQLKLIFEDDPDSHTYFDTEQYYEENFEN